MILAGVVAEEKPAGGGGGSPSPPAAFIASIEVAAGVNSTTGYSGGAASIDTTGATLLVAILRGNGSPGSITDSAGNTWNYGTTVVASGSACRLRVAWVSAPATSSTHTFAVSGGGGEASAEVYAFSGSSTGWTLDSQAGAPAHQSGTSVVTGSVTPSATGEIIVAAVGSNGSLSTATMSNGFSGGVSGQATNYALPQHLSGTPELGASGYLIDASSAAISTTFTTSASNGDWNWIIAAFKAN